jgi:cell wall-associated NlpC family hydrolase
MIVGRMDRLGKHGRRRRCRAFARAGVIFSAWLLAGLSPAAAQSRSGGSSDTPLWASHVDETSWSSASRRADAVSPWASAVRRHTGRETWTGAAPLRSSYSWVPNIGEHLEMRDFSGSPLLEFAVSLLGRPYRFGSDRGAFDCSGFVRRVFGEFGVRLPHSSRQQFALGRWVSRHDLQVGDLVFFRTTARGPISHVGIYIGDGKFVHAARKAGRVRIDPLDHTYYSSRYAGARRLQIDCSVLSQQC